MHLFRRRRRRRAFAFGLAATSLYMLMIVVTTVVLVSDGTHLAAPRNPRVLRLVYGVYALREARSRRRLSTSGLAPTGFTLGASGLTLLDPHTTRHIPWGDVSHVVATNARTRGGKSPLHPIIQLVLGTETVTLHMSQYLESAAVVYTSLTTAVDDAGFRGMPGDSRARRRTRDLRVPRKSCPSESWTWPFDFARMSFPLALSERSARASRTDIDAAESAEV